VIPRNLAVTVALLCSLTLGMSLYLWELHRREATSGAREVVPQHVTAPASGSTETVTIVLARDDTGELRSKSISIPAFNNRQQRAEEILRQLLTIYQEKDSQHPLIASAEIRDVYMVDPNTAVVDVNSALVDGQTSGILAEELTVVSIIQTLSLNVRDLARVKLVVDGKERETLAGHVDLSCIYDVGEVSQLAKQMWAQ
jgi:Sporulation and spore germination